MTHVRHIYCVIYLWRGERHRHLKDFTACFKAHALAEEFRADGWQAWVEKVK